MRKKSKNTVLLVIIGALGVIFAVILVMIVFARTKNSFQYKQQLSLGDKYFQEMDYENAELCYLAAIKIDEKKVTPYVNLSGVYMQTEHIDEAYEILELAGDKVDQKYFDEVEKQRKEVEKREQEIQEAGKTEVLSESAEDGLDVENQEKTTRFVKSSTMQEYKGTIYTILDVNDDAGMTKILGNYMSSILVYDDYIYYTDVGGTGGGPTQLMRMHLDGSGYEVLVNDLESESTFCVYDNVLYYQNSTTYFNEDDGCVETEMAGRSIDLETMEIREEDFIFLTGNENNWIVFQTYDEFYYSAPGFEQVHKLSADVALYQILGIYDSYMYYYFDQVIYRCSLENFHIETIATDVLDFKMVLSESGLYYFDMENEKLIYRIELEDMSVKTYDLSGMSYDVWGVWQEIGEKAYFSTGTDDYRLNTEYWELDLENAEIRSLGVWFMS